MKKVIAVIVAYNNPHELDEVFTSIENQTYEVKNIICVENSLSDYIQSNIDIVNRFQKKINIEYIVNNGTKSSAEGFRQGMLYALKHEFDFIWLNDQDGLPDKKCLERLIVAFEGNNSKPGVYTPLIIARDGGYPLQNFHAKFNCYKHAVKIDYENLGRLEKIDYSGTTGNLIHKEVIKKCGVYNSKAFYVGREDIEYCCRVKRYGFDLFLVSGARYSHPDLYIKYKLDISITSKILCSTYLEHFVPLFIGDVYQNTAGDYDKRECYYAIGNSYICTMYCSKFAQFINYTYSIIRLVFIKLRQRSLSIRKTLQLYKRGREFANEDKERC